MPDTKLLNITGELRDWVKVENSNGHYYWGYVFGDTKGRFPNGRLIHTSQVVHEDVYGHDTVAVTLNSRYLLRAIHMKGFVNDEEDQRSQE